MPRGPQAAAAASGRRTAKRTTALAFLAVLTAALVAVPLTGAQSTRSGGSPTAGQVHAVTLVTGDVVRLAIRSDGKRSVSLEPADNGTMPEVAITEAGEHLYVIPQKAARLLAQGRLDLELFDVAGLVELRYDDARRSTIPVIVDYGRGAQAADESRQAALDDARKTVTISSIGAAAYAASKERAREFWRSLTTGADASGAATGLSDGAARVDLDGRVEAALDVSVPQIHAPEAWAAGWDGTGATVAVLDTGFDPTHPDLAGQVAESANFTTDPSAVDGNGHGTHVASTVAGTGAASGGTYRGVAPGADLLIGKVLADDGFGEDSWVLAGMEWAVSKGADVVSMSLGGDTTDGTDPLSRAIDDLSAQSDSLFVVAAGNNGSNASTVTAPGAATSALTVGAVDATDSLAWFSSRGPRLGDHAVKPDVVAPGVSITAARAAGTAIGNPVDDHYTDVDGTSMATPHVSGVAAILADEHPSWDGERLKAAISASTVAAPGSSAFEAGTGRVDAANAITQTVVSSPSLDLGFFPFPQGDLSPKQTPLTYTNLGSATVTLKLSVAAQDPTASAPAGVTLSASELTVPAGTDVRVDVVLDPKVASTGDSSGVIVAESDDGTSVRTAFGFVLESEHYDLTVEIDPRDGTQSASHTLALIGLDTFSYDQRELVGNGSPQSVTFRVPPGTYSAGALTFALAGDEAREGVVTFEPVIRLTSDTKVVLAGDDAQRFSYVTSRPSSSDGQIMMVDWATAEGGFAGLILGGNADRVYATPGVSSGDVTFTSSLNWMLSQPAAEILPSSGDAVALQSLAGPEQQPWDVPVTKLDGRYQVVDAGEAGNIDASTAKRSIAVVSGTCGDLTEAARAFAAAGAVAMVAYAGDGAECAGTVEQPSPLPAFQARSFDAARLLGSARKPSQIVTHHTTKYIYDLMGAWSDRVPAGAVLDGRASRVATFDEQYDSLGGTTRQGYRVWDMRLGWVPERGVAAFGLVRPVSVPGGVRHYASPIAEWERWVEVRSAEGFPEASLSAPSVPVVAGKTITDRWFGSPITYNASPLLEKYGWQSYPYRQGDFMWMFALPWVDDAGHVGGPLYLNEFEGKLYRDGELVLQSEEPIFMQYFADPEPHDYELVFTTKRENGFWQRGTTAETAWKFRSQTTEGDHEVLPLLSVDYDLKLTKTNSAPAGAYRFGVRLGMPLEVATAPLAELTVEVSWDRGSTWQRASLRDCDGSGCTAQVQNPRSGSASLRVSATDTAGRSLAQTVIDAYVVG